AASDGGGIPPRVHAVLVVRGASIEGAHAIGRGAIDGHRHVRRLPIRRGSHRWGKGIGRDRRIGRRWREGIARVRGGSRGKRIGGDHRGGWSGGWDIGRGRG